MAVADQLRQIFERRAALVAELTAIDTELDQTRSILGMPIMAASTSQA